MKKYLNIVIIIVCVATSACATHSSLRYPPVRWLADDDNIPIEKSKVKIEKKSKTNMGIDADLSRQVTDIMNFAEQLSMLPMENAYAGREEALNVNNFDEVPDSTWFTNRLGRFEMPTSEIAHGPNKVSPPKGPWDVLAVGTAGKLATILVSNGKDRFAIDFDTPQNGEATSGGAVIANLILYAAGYRTSEKYVSYFSREEFKTNEDELNADLKKMFDGLAPNTNGKYRAILSVFPEGSILGPISFNKKRSGDTNDRIPHEHRRELRGLRVFASFLNDSAAGSSQTADIFTTTDGQKGVVGHYIIRPSMSLGEVFGYEPAGGRPEEKRTVDAIFSFGFYNPYWTTSDNSEVKPSIDFTDMKSFNPEKWKQKKHNVAFKFMTRRDAFWAARIISRFSDEDLAAVVAAAKFSNPEIERKILEGLIARRDKIKSCWFSKLPPLDNVHIESANGDTKIYFDDLNQVGNYRYRIQNYTGKIKLTDWIETSTQMAAIPSSLIERISNNKIHTVKIQSKRTDEKWWSPPVDVYIKKSEKGIEVMGIKRL